jgi:hypothetical protein
MLRRGLSLLLEHVCDHNRVHVNPIDNPPGHILVLDPQLVAPATDGRHWPRVRQAQLFTSLKAPEQHSRFDASHRRQRRRAHLSMEPHQRPVRGCHPSIYVISDISSRGRTCRLCNAGAMPDNEIRLPTCRSEATECHEGQGCTAAAAALISYEIVGRASDKSAP